jgi:hypothetical protein
MRELSNPTKTFIWFSAATAVLHFAWETWFHLQWGQFLPMLIVDYIAIGLLLLGAFGFLKWDWGPGLLCGAWGFEFCLNYRTFFIRVQDILEGTADEVTTNTAYALGSLLSLSAIAFLISIIICIQQYKSAS